MEGLARFTQVKTRDNEFILIGRYEHEGKILWTGYDLQGEYHTQLDESRFVKKVTATARHKLYEIMTPVEKKLSADAMRTRCMNTLLDPLDFFKSKAIFAVALAFSRDHGELANFVGNNSYHPGKIVDLANFVLGGYRIAYPVPSVQTWVEFIEGEAFLLIDSLNV